MRTKKSDSKVCCYFLLDSNLVDVTSIFCRNQLFSLSSFRVGKNPRGVGQSKAFKHMNRICSAMFAIHVRFYRPNSGIFHMNAFNLTYSWKAHKCLSIYRLYDTIYSDQNQKHHITEWIDKNFAICFILWKYLHLKQGKWENWILSSTEI